MVKKNTCVFISGYGSNLKALIEHDKLIIQDFDIIAELSTYILKGKEKYEAEEGANDDLVACLVMFSWLSNQTYFKELTDQDIRARLVDEQSKLLEQDMAPFGFVVNGLEDENIGQAVDEYGTRWSPVVRKYDSNW